MSRWFSRLRGGADADPLVYLFAHAGGNGSAYVSVVRALRATAEVRSVDLPGRGRRIADPAIRSLDELVALLIDGLELPRTRPILFAGHSFGALVAFTLALRLHESGMACPRRLVLSGRGAPGRPLRLPHAYKMPDPELIAVLKGYGGTPAEVFESAELLELVLPPLRADLEMNANARVPERRRLPCSITCAAGSRDPEVSDEDLAAWAEWAGNGFRTERFDGGHFFLLAGERYGTLLSEEIRLLTA